MWQWHNILSTATIVPILDLSLYTEEVRIEFDNDWNVYDSDDEAHVEVIQMADLPGLMCGLK